MTIGVDLGHAQARHVQAATVVEVELLVLVDHRIGVDRRAEIQAALRQASDHARLGGESDVIQHLFLVGHLRHAFGHADAKIDDSAHRQFERTAAGNDLSLVQRHGSQHVQRHLELTRERRVIDGGVGLHVILGPGHHDAIHQHAGNLYLTRIECSVRANALDLSNDETVGVLGRHRQSKIVERQGLALHGDVAAQIGGGAAKQCHRDRKCLVEQPLLVVNLHDSDQVFGGAMIDLAALLARIDEGSQADFGKSASPMPGDVAKKLGHRSQRQVVGLDTAFHSHGGKFGHQTPMATDCALYQAIARQAIQTAVLAVTGRGGKQQGQVTRRTRLRESLLERRDQLVGRAATDEAGAGDSVAVANDGDSVGGRNDLVFHRASVPDAARSSHCAFVVSAIRKSSIKSNCSSAISAGACPQLAISMERMRPCLARFRISATATHGPADAPAPIVRIMLESGSLRSKHDDLPHRLAFMQEVEAKVDVLELELAAHQAIDRQAALPITVRCSAECRARERRCQCSCP